MSIHFISGKPGGGKSLYGVRLIVEELRHGHRVIITNVPLKLDALAEYFAKDEKVVDVGSRVIVLDDDQTAEFWTYRPGCRIPRLTQQQWNFEGARPSYAGVKDSGVMYVIDEVHNYFGARQWAQTGRDVLFYLSQHRKLGDTVICITQAIENVDKQFRSVTQDFTYVRNLNKEKFGMFRLPGIFLRRTYTSPATDTSVPMETGTFRLDVSGYAALYDSAAGVGIHGRVADMAEKRKGAPLWLFFVGIAVLGVFAFVAVPEGIATVFLTPEEKARRRGDPQVVSQAPVAVKAEDVPKINAGNQISESSLTMPVSGVSTNVFISGMAVLDRKVTVWLTDGTKLFWPKDAAEIKEISDRHVIWRGVEYRFKGP